jgi:hypothetical protein
VKSSQVETGGLFRCCVQTVMLDPGPDEQGRTITCHYCGNRVTFERGAWRDLELSRREHAPS